MIVAVALDASLEARLLLAGSSHSCHGLKKPEAPRSLSHCHVLYTLYVPSPYRCP